MLFAWKPEVYPLLTSRARQLASLIAPRPGPAAWQELFTESLKERLPGPKLSAHLRSLWRQHGAVVGLEPLQVSGQNVGLISMLTNRLVRLRMSLTLELDPPGRIADFSCQSDPLTADFPLLQEAFQQLPGQAGLCLWELTDDGPVEILGYEPERAMAVASVFKIYIVGAMLGGTTNWDEPLLLNESARSFPTGILHHWPAGTPLTTQSLATLMICLSDNTAADILMQRVGKEQVEAAVRHMGHAQPELLTPILSTLDLVRLKSHPEEQRCQRFLALDGPGRRAMLSELAGQPRATLGLSPLPSHLEVGWWASPADLCRAMAWLWQNTQPKHPVREMMAVNPGLLVSPTRWPYLGFKGGGEAGALAASLLFQHASGKTYALGAAWNNSENTIQENRFFALLESIFWALPGQNIQPGEQTISPLPPAPASPWWQRLFSRSSGLSAE